MTINTYTDINCLKELKNFKETSTIYDFLPPEFKKASKEVVQPLNAFHQSLFSFSSTIVSDVEAAKSPNETKRIKKLFLKKVLGWRDELSDHFWSINFDPPKLKCFQNSIREVMEQNKLGLVNGSLQKLNIKSTTLNNAVLQLNKEMSRFSDFTILREVRREKDKPAYYVCDLPITDDESNSSSFVSVPSPKASRHPICRSKSASDLLETLKDSTANDDERVLSEGDETNCISDTDLLFELQAQSLLTNTSTKNKNWQNELVKEFSSIDNCEVIKLVGKFAAFGQVGVLVEYILNHKSQHWKMCYLIGSLNLQNLDELIYQLEKPKLLEINKALSNKAFSDVEWLRENIEGKVQEWIDQCNDMKVKIDNLCKLLRQDHTGCKLCRADIATINSYRKEVEKQQCITQKIQWLIQNIPINGESIHVSTKGTSKEYRCYYTRLTEKHEYEGRAAGCLWGIIYRNVFERIFRNKIDNYDQIEAAAMFDDWAIILASDFRKVGLLGDINEIQFQKLKNDEKLLEKIVNSVLKQLGITKIKHWKQKEIFNYVMLKEHLSRPEIRMTINPIINKLCELSL
jgi:hypothetical protein